MVNPKGALIRFVASPTFMLGIWHRDDWMKEIFVSSNLWSGGTWKSLAWLHFSYLYKSSFPLVYYVQMCLLLCGYNVCSIIVILVVIC